MLPGEELERIMDVIHEFSDATQADLTEEFRYAFSADRADEIIAELSKDGVLKWANQDGTEYLTGALPCSHCQWNPCEHVAGHAAWVARRQPGYPHYYDYTIPSTP